MTDARPRRLDLLVLARLATTSSRPPSVGRLDADLFPFVQARLSRSEWSSYLADCLETLHAKGDIDERRVPTAAGLERLREALRIRTLPDRWVKISRALLPALALQLPGRRWSDVASADKLRARVIRQAHDLAVPEAPTLAQAVDARIWQALGLDEAGPLTLGKLRRAVLEQTLGSPLRARSLDTDRAGQWLATAAAGTTTREITAIQRALIDQWLFTSEEPTTTTSTPAEATTTAPDSRGPREPDAEQRETESPSSESPPLEHWARRVQQLAESTDAGRYGDERVFIASVWPKARAESLSKTLPAFKARLIEANRAGHVRLHRADLVGAMDPQLVRDSEARHLNATFHFIEIPPRSNQ